MVSPLECSWYIETLLGMLAVVFILLLLNFVLVACGKTESQLYKQYDSFSNLYIKLFSFVLLGTILWILLASIFKAL